MSNDVHHEQLANKNQRVKERNNSSPWCTSVLIGTSEGYGDIFTLNPLKNLLYQMCQITEFASWRALKI